MKQLNLLKPFAIATVFFSIVCCQEKNLIVDDNLDGVIARYVTTLRDSQDEITLVLNGIDSKMNILRIDNPMSWIEVSSGKDYDVNVLKMKRLSQTPFSFSKDSLYVRFSEEECATVVIMRDEAVIPNGDNKADYAKFNKTWWEQEEILLTTTTIENGQPKEQSEIIALPWATAAISNMPSSLIFSSEGTNLLSANNGWEMAFNLFESSTKDGYVVSKPYFCLYNRFTGTLRVFYYQKETTGYAGEFCFLVTPGLDNTQKYPLYNSLQFGIPMSAGEIQSKGNVLGVTNSASNMFQQYVTPYIKNSETTALKPGWYCFDLDYSAYNPNADTSFKPNVDRLSFDCMTASVAGITLRGALAGKIDGEFEATTEYSTTTANGNNYLDQFNSGITHLFTDCYDNLLSENYLTGVFYGGLSIYNFSKALLGYATDDYTTKGKTVGTINMNLGANMTMDGYSVSQTSNSAISVEFDCASFNQSEHLGQGVWSLQENPVVYVVSDYLLSAYDDVSFTIKPEGLSTFTMNPQDADLRLFTFFDPASLKPNINTKAFGQIKNMEMFWVYGVYPNLPLGYFDKYKNGILEYDKKKEAVAKPSLVDRSNPEVKDEVGFMMSEMYKYGTTCSMWEMDKEKRCKIDEGAQGNYYYQKDTTFRYYGYPSNSQSSKANDFFLADPIVLLPSTYGKNGNNPFETGMLYDFIAPDYVVGVVISITHVLQDNTEAKTILSKLFLPEVRSITTEEFQKMYNGDRGEESFKVGDGESLYVAKDQKPLFQARSNFMSFTQKK